MKCFYHNDADGRCAGAIVWRTRDSNRKGEMIELEYKDEIPISKIEPSERIVIVDFSFKPEVMEKVFERTKDIIWIDHHKTAFEYKYSENLKGIRDNRYSGCELTWKYFAQTSVIPEAVKLIGDRDTWHWKYGERTANFNMGLMLYPHQPEDEIWEDLLFQAKKLDEIIVQGKTCVQFRNMFCADYVKSYGFETEFEGHNCFALGIYMFGSESFGSKLKEYDICLSYEFLGDKWIIGLYSEKIDVSEIAEKYAGGGHKGAAGFISEELPFRKKEHK